MFAIHVKPGPVSFSARLQTTFALLIPRLWWSAPPDRLLRLPLRVIMIRVPLRCHSSSPPHSFQSGFGVSFALNSALWLSTVSVEHSLQLWCASAVSTLRFADSDVTPHCCFFSCNDKAMCGSREMPLKDMTGVKIWYPSVRLRCFSSEHMWDAHKKQAATLDSFLVCSQDETEGLTVKWDENSKQDCLSVPPACENRLKSYWPVQSGMCWTLSLEEGKPNGLLHLIKNGYVDILYRMLVRVTKVFVWAIDEILRTLHR